MSIPIISRLSISDYIRVSVSLLLLTVEYIIFTITLLVHCIEKSLPLRKSYIKPFLNNFNESKCCVLEDATYMIRQRGYECEEHTVITPDGYFLVLHRILPKKPNTYYSHGLPILFIHGCMMNAEVWICQKDISKCYPFVLSDKGFDVWLGNLRGNKYSYKHKYMTPKDRKFWDFSLDEFVIYDIPSFISYILSITKAKKLSYIGFSQGTTIALASLSIDPTLIEKINCVIALAATTVPKGLQSGFASRLVRTSPELIYLFFGRKAFMTSVTFWNKLLPMRTFSQMIDGSLEVLFNWTSKNVERNEKTDLYRCLYSFTSVKTIVHWFQIIRAQRFQMYDDEDGTKFISPLDAYIIPLIQKLYSKGRESTERKRSHHISPIYCLSKVKTLPILLLNGRKDTLVNIHKTLDDLVENYTSCPIKDISPSVKAQTCSNISILYIEHYEHLDFLWSHDLDQVVAPHLVAYILKNAKKSLL